MIRWLLQSTLCLILCPLVAAQQVAPPAAPTDALHPIPEFVTIPKGTKIELVLLDPLSSATNKRGDSIRFAVAEDVIVNGIVAIPAGTPVAGIVTAVKKMIPRQSSGHIYFRPVSINLAGHNILLLSDEVDWGLLPAVILAMVIAAPIVLPAITVRHLIKKKSNAAGKNAKVTDDRIIPPCIPQNAYLKSATRIRVAAIAAPSTKTAAELLHCKLLPTPVTAAATQ
jgi:hypothetical protein